MLRDEVWTSYLSVPSSLAAGSVGLEPVGEVMGAIATGVGWRGYGAIEPGTGRTRYGTTTSGDASGSLGYRPYARAVNSAYTAAMRRLVADAVTQDAHGVLGIGFDLVEDDDETVLEVVLRGTAVRADPRPTPVGVFTTDLDGSQVSALMRGGWAPLAAVWGFSIGVRPPDWTAAQQRRRAARPQEVTGYTDLVSAVRADARDQLAARARRAGARGVLAPSMTLRQRSETVCEAWLRGTAITGVTPEHHAVDGSSALPILPLHDGTAGPAAARPDR